ncbi:MAG: ArsR family transcriptional regulator [ANME-2 cluster archaeon]|nr:MAG: ArsR family transcriptional regulator [ANME-2 cluster archaeon]
MEAIKLGAADYISKPFKIDEIKIKKILEEVKFETTTAPALDSDSIKDLANAIRKDVVRLLYSHEKLKFTEIQHHLKIRDATKLSFHLRVLKSAGILDQDTNRVYFLTSKGKKLLEALGNL